MRLNKLLLVGAVFALIGVIGAGLTFSNLTAIDGQTFVDQIDTSTEIEKFQDYQVGDEVIIVDEIVRMEENEDGNTHVWLESIGKSDSDIPFIFISNIMDDYGIGSNIKITFTVVQDSVGHDTPEGYQNSPPGLSPDSLNRGNPSSFFTISIAFIITGIGLVFFWFQNRGHGIVTRMRRNQQPLADDWGMPVAPPAPPMASMPTAPPVGAPPMASMPTAPPVGAPPPANQPSTMTITVPPGVVPGQVLTVTMPSGQVVNVQVPSGSTSGSQFTITVQQ